MFFFVGLCCRQLTDEKNVTKNSHRPIIKIAIRRQYWNRRYTFVLLKNTNRPTLWTTSLLSVHRNQHTPAHYIYIFIRYIMPVKRDHLSWSSSASSSARPFEMLEPKDQRALKRVDCSALYLLASSHMMLHAICCYYICKNRFIYINLYSPINNINSAKLISILTF